MARVVAMASLLILLGAGSRASVPNDGSMSMKMELQPNPSQARELERWPTRADLDRLASVEGRTRAETLHILGHPCRVERRPDGLEVWAFPWLAACQVFLRNGVVVGTFYTGGY